MELSTQDKLDIIELAARYAFTIDRRMAEEWADCFTEDATLTTRRGTRTGRDAVVAYYREALADPIERRHFLANQDVEVTGADAGTVRAMFAYTYSGEGVGILGWGRYVDEVRLDDAGVGRISAKTISIDVHADPRDGWAR